MVTNVSSVLRNVRLAAVGARLMPVCFVALGCAAVVGVDAMAHGAAPGRIVGHLDGIGQDGEQFFVSGWACQQGQTKSIAVHVTADTPASANDSSKRLFAPGMANLDNELAVAQACQDHDGGKHRFFIVLPIGYDGVGKVYANGIRIVDGVPNTLLAGSGTRLTKAPGLNPPFPVPPPPAISGSYHGATEHPRVFTTAAELKDIASRINRPGSYSNERFVKLTGDIAHDLTSGINWDTTYSGCIGAVYQHTFSVEQAAGVEELLRSNLHLDAGVKLPRGGAVVASRLALYAALVKAGATAPTGAPGADQAAALAKQILLAWADHGFPRDGRGHFLLLPALSCEANGNVNLLGAAGPALMLGGVAFSVHAQDLLQYLGALNADETHRLDIFHDAMFDIIRQSENVKFGYGGIPFPAPPVARYGNIDSGALANLLAIARLHDDERKLKAVLYGGDPLIPVALPWLQFFNRTIYGEGDTPLGCGVHTIECSHNPKDPPKYPGFQTTTVVAGEITDRLRNEHTGNSFGYTAGNLRTIVKAAEVLRLSGFDAYGYRGSHKQSIEMAIGFYACFGKTPGFYKTVTMENAGGCANAAQYDGKIVNDVDRMVMVGAYRFPGNKPVAALDAAAKIASKTFPVDPIIFGLWRD